MNFFEKLGSGDSVFYIVTICLVVLMTITAIVVLLLEKRNRKKIEPIVEIVPEIEEEPTVTEEVERELEKTKAQKELEALMKQMENDLEGKAEEAVSTYEQEQEEKAIISYQELVKNAKKKDISPQAEQLDFEKELTLDIPQEEEEELPTAKNPTGFRSTEFISPVFGKVESKMTYPKVEEFHTEKAELKSEKNHPTREEKRQREEFEESPLERTINMKPLSEEMKKNEDFLEALKEFRKNL